MYKQNKEEFAALLKSKLTPAEILRAVDLIRCVAHSDAEAAHGMEDDLFEAVLHAIANSKGSRVSRIEMAKAALTSKDLPFSRWCA